MSVREKLDKARMSKIEINLQRQKIDLFKEIKNSVENIEYQLESLNTWCEKFMKKLENGVDINE